MSDSTFVVHPAQTGCLLAAGGLNPITVAGNTATRRPSRVFFPGELVEVTASSALRTADGDPLVPLVWQFQAAASQASALFASAGPPLGNFTGLGVALGDLDQDGDLDAFVANSRTPFTTASNQVWLNDGAGRLTLTSQDLGNAISRGVALGDLDADGDLDAFVSNLNGDTVWCNNGKGIFAQTEQSLGNDISFGVALGDLDGDGDLDAFVAENNGCKVWRNDGHAFFTDSGQAFPGVEARAVALGDLDGDGDLDAFVAYDNFQPNKVWLNDGLASFSDSGQNLGNAESSSVALGDFDGDGDLDALVANPNSPNEVWLNGGAGGFTSNTNIPNVSGSFAVALGDLDGDGDLDVFLGNEHRANEVWLNQRLAQGSIRFAATGQELGTTNCNAIGLGDLDGDGDLDALAVNGEEQPDQVWLNCNLRILRIGPHPTGQPDGLSVEAQGVPNRLHRLESSTNLSTWTTTTTKSADSGGLVSLPDDRALSLPSRFYRVVIP